MAKHKIKFKRKKITPRVMALVISAFFIILAATTFAYAQANTLAAGKNPDFDSNGIVGYPDFFLFADNWGRTGDTIFDLNGDARISLDDFFIFADYFGKKVEITGPKTILTACQEITAPGNYVLQNDLASLAGKTCINIHDVSDVHLDCANHSIGHWPDRSGHSETALKIKGVNNFSVSGCELIVTKPHTFVLDAGFPIVNSNNGVIENNVIRENFPILIKNSSGLKFTNNKANAFYEQENSSNNLISGNEFVFVNPGSNLQASAMILSYKGSRNTISNNKINGGWDGFDWTKKSTNVDLSQISDGNPDKVGADDGIVLTDESNATVSNNSIENNFDCGIETIGFIHDSVFSGNSIKNSPICGIGGWYDSKWRNNTVVNNTAEKVPVLFLFNFTPGFKPSDETSIYFENNTFSGNKFAEQAFRTFGNKSATFDFYSLSKNSQNIFKNNVFTNNDFNINLSSPFIFPKEMAVDGGGNICGKPGIFTSYADRYKHPLKCPGVQYCIEDQLFKYIKNEFTKPEADRDPGVDLNYDSKIDSADLADATSHLCPGVN